VFLEIAPTIRFTLRRVVRFGNLHGGSASSQLVNLVSKRFLGVNEPAAKALERNPGIPSNRARAVSAIFRTACSSKLSP
jgi:hypothetical protein